MSTDAASPSRPCDTTLDPPDLPPLDGGDVDACPGVAHFQTRQKEARGQGARDASRRERKEIGEGDVTSKEGCRRGLRGHGSTRASRRRRDEGRAAMTRLRKVAGAGDVEEGGARRAEWQ
jgi:hypothetical protein